MSAIIATNHPGHNHPNHPNLPIHPIRPMNPAAKAELDRQLMLQVNQSLFQKGKITEEMYIKAKELIFRR